jgi:NADH-quinone oxidoreductase subunit J
MVLYVFVVAYVGGDTEPTRDPIPGQRFLAPLMGAALFIELSIAVLGSSLLALSTEGPDIGAGFGNPAAIGKLLLEDFLLAFEASSILLLLAAVGAVVLAGKRESANGAPASGPSGRHSPGVPAGPDAGAPEGAVR